MFNQLLNSGLKVNAPKAGDFIIDDYTIEVSNLGANCPVIELYDGDDLELFNGNDLPEPIDHTTGETPTQNNAEAYPTAPPLDSTDFLSLAWVESSPPLATHLGRGKSPGHYTHSK